MKQIRSGVFETNSSSTHSLTMCTQEEFDKWKRGELLFDCYSERFADIVEMTDYDKEKARNNYDSVRGSYWKEWSQLSDEEINSWYNKYANENLRDKHSFGLQTYREWSESYELEHFTHHYTSPSGDKIVAFGKYGYDG